MRIGLYLFGIIIGMFPVLRLAAQQDSSRLLVPVIIHSRTSPDLIDGPAPAQSLDRQSLKQLNVLNAGDAAKYFAGVLVKDYGGAGGLKTISVRSLGASNTSILYDGVPVSDVQTGQIDLGRFSNSFLQSIELYQGNMQGTLLPARAYSAGSVLTLNTINHGSASISAQSTITSTDSSNRVPLRWNADLHAGSFGYLQGAAGLRMPVAERMLLTISMDAIHSDGDYPYHEVNGQEVTKKKRINSELNSFQPELNLLKIFQDGSMLEFKTWAYTARRGLPGGIIFYNDRSTEALQNDQVSTQARYRRRLGVSTDLALTAKWSHDYTRYTDPDFLNNQGGLDQRYRQQEFYGSVAIGRRIGNHWWLDLASDIALTRLSANNPGFVFPSRLSAWNVFGIGYADSLWKLNVSILSNLVHDETRSGGSAGDEHRWTPALAVSRKLSAFSPFMLRASYKHLFRMPTFNDLYYNFIGNLDLRPEYARSWNLGLVFSKMLNGSIRELNVSVDGYVNHVKDKIVAVPSQNLFVWSMLNLGKVRIRGIDLTLDMRGSITATVSWNARLAYTWQQAQDVTDPNSSRFRDRIPYTPDHSGSGIFGLRFQQWQAGYNLLFSGTRYTLGENNPTNQLDGWGTQDLFIARRLELKTFSMEIRAQLNNLADARYDVVRYYPMPGRSFKLSLVFNQ